MKSGSAFDEDGELIDVNKVQTALASVGVSLMDAQGQFRDFDDVIFELADTWDTLSKNQQRYVATIAAGNRQQSRFIALVSNSERLHEMADAAANSEDAGLIQYAKTLDSLESKQANLKTSFQQFYMDILNGEFFKSTIEWLTSILDGLNKLGNWTKVSTIITFITSFKTLLKLGSTFAGEVGAPLVKGYEDAFKQILAKAEETGRKINSHIHKGVEQSNAAGGAVSATEAATGGSSRTSVSGSRGVSTGLAAGLAGANVLLTLVGTSVAGNGNGRAGSIITAVGSAAGGALTGAKLGTALGGPGVGTGVGAAIGALISILTSLPGIFETFANSLQEKVDNAKKVSEEKNVERAEAKAKVSDLESGIEKIKTLEKKKYNSDEAYDEWITANNELFEKFPELTATFENGTDAIINMSAAENALAAAREKALQAANEAAKAAEEQAKAELEQAKEEQQQQREEEVSLHEATIGDQIFLTASNVLNERALSDLNQLRRTYAGENKGAGNKSYNIVDGRSLNSFSVPYASLVNSGIDVLQHSDWLFGHENLSAEQISTSLYNNLISGSLALLDGITADQVVENYTKGVYSTLAEWTAARNEADQNLAQKEEASRQASRNRAIVATAGILGTDQYAEEDWQELTGSSSLIQNAIADAFVASGEEFSDWEGNVSTLVAKYAAAFAQLNEYLETNGKIEDFNDLVKSFEKGEISWDEFQNQWKKLFSGIDETTQQATDLYFQDAETEITERQNNLWKKFSTDERQVKFGGGENLQITTEAAFNKFLNSIGETYYDEIVAYYDGLEDKIASGKISIGAAQEQANAYLSLIQRATNLPIEQRTKALEILFGESTDLLSSIGQGEAQKALDEAGIQLDVSSIPLFADNLVTAYGQLEDNLASGIETFTEQIEKATEGTNYEEAKKIATKLGTSVKDSFDFVDGQYFIKSGIDVATELSKYYTDQIDRVNKEWDKQIKDLTSSDEAREQFVLGSYQDAAASWKSSTAGQAWIKANKQGVNLEDNVQVVQAYIEYLKESATAALQDELDYEIQVTNQAMALNGDATARRTREVKQLLQKTGREGYSDKEIIKLQNSLGKAWEGREDFATRIGDTDTFRLSDEAWKDLKEAHGSLYQTLYRDSVKATAETLKEESYSLGAKLSSQAKGLATSDVRTLLADVTGDVALDEVSAILFKWYLERGTENYLNAFLRYSKEHLGLEIDEGEVKETATNFQRGLKVGSVEYIESLTEKQVQIFTGELTKADVAALEDEGLRKALEGSFNNLSAMTSETAQQLVKEIITRYTGIVEGEELPKEERLSYSSAKKNLATVFQKSFDSDILAGTVDEVEKDFLTTLTSEQLEGLSSLYSSFSDVKGATSKQASEAIADAYLILGEEYGKIYQEALVLRADGTYGLNFAQIDSELRKQSSSELQYALQANQNAWNEYNRISEETVEGNFDTVSNALQTLATEGKLSAKEANSVLDDLTLTGSQKQSLYTNLTSGLVDWQTLGSQLITAIKNSYSDVDVGKYEQEIAELQAQILDAILSSISSLADNLSAGLEGTLSAADYNSLASHYDLTGVGTRTTVNGVSLGQADIDKLLVSSYDYAKSAGLAGAEWGAQFYEAVRNSGTAYGDLFEVEDQAKAARSEYQELLKEARRARKTANLAKNYEEVNGKNTAANNLRFKDTAANLDAIASSAENAAEQARSLAEALNSVASAATLDPDNPIFNFMEQEVAGGLTKNFDNFISQIDKVQSSLQTLKKKGSKDGTTNWLDYEDFVNYFGFLEAAYDQALSQFGEDVDTKSPALAKLTNLLEASGHSYEDFVNSVLANTDRWGKVDIGGIAAEMDISVDAAMSAMSEAMSEGLKNVAQQQVKYLSGLEKMLEAMLALESIGEINESFSFNFDVGGEEEVIHLWDFYEQLPDDEKKQAEYILTFKTALEGAGEAGKNLAYAMFGDGNFDATLDGLLIQTASKALKDNKIDNSVITQLGSMMRDDAQAFAATVQAMFGDAYDFEEIFTFDEQGNISGVQKGMENTYKSLLNDMWKAYSDPEFLAKDWNKNYLLDFQQAAQENRVKTDGDGNHQKYIIEATATAPEIVYSYSDDEKDYSFKIENFENMLGEDGKVTQEAREAIAEQLNGTLFAGTGKEVDVGSINLTADGDLTFDTLTAVSDTEKIISTLEEIKEALTGENKLSLDISEAKSQLEALREAAEAALKEIPVTIDFSNLDGGDPTQKSGLGSLSTDAQNAYIPIFKIWASLANTVTLLSTIQTSQAMKILSTDAQTAQEAVEAVDGTIQTLKETLSSDETISTFVSSLATIIQGTLDNGEVINMSSLLNFGEVDTAAIETITTAINTIQEALDNISTQSISEIGNAAATAESKLDHMVGELDAAAGALGNLGNVEFNIDADALQVLATALSTLNEQGELIVTFSEEGADAVVGQANSVRDAVNEVPSSHNTGFSVSGVSSVIAKAAMIQAALALIPRSISIGVGLKFGGIKLPFFSGNVPSGEALLNGKNYGTALSGKTLVGELGPELAVYDNQYHLLGENGAEFVDLPSDAIVFNHLQTEGILNGKVDDIRGTQLSAAYKHAQMFSGNALVNGNVTGPAFAGGGIASALAAVRRAKSVWQGLLNSLSAADLLGGGGGGGGGGGRGKYNSLKPYIGDLQEWYNLSRQIADLEAHINTLVAKRNNLSKGFDQGETYLRNLKESQALLEDQLNTQRDLYRYQIDELERQANAINDSANWVSKFYRVGEDGVLQYVEGNETNGGKGALEVLQELNEMGDNAERYTIKDQIDYIKQITGGAFKRGYTWEEETDDEGNGTGNYKKKEWTDEEYVQEFFSALQEPIDDYDALQDAVNEAEVEIEDLASEIEKINDEIRDNEIDLTQLIYDAIVDVKEKAIENLEESNKLITDANKAYADSISDAIAAEKQQYEQNQSIADRESMQRQLSLLRRSGGSVADIRALEQAIDEKFKDEYFNDQQSSLDAIREANEKQQELMEQQVQIMKDSLEYEKENGVLWTKVYEILNEGYTFTIDFLSGAGADGFLEKANIEQEKMLEEWAFKIGLYGENERSDIMEAKYAQPAYEALVNNSSSWAAGYKQVFEGMDAATKEGWKKDYIDTYNSYMLENTSGASSDAEIAAAQKAASAKAEQTFFEHIKQEKKRQDDNKAAEEAKKQQQQQASSSSSSGGGSGSSSSSSSKKSSATKYTWTNSVTGESGYAYSKSAAQGALQASYNNYAKAAGGALAGTTTKTELNKKIEADKKAVKKSKKTGGSVENTDLYMLHGSPQNPEYVLNAKQTRGMEQLINFTQRNPDFVGILKKHYDSLAGSISSQNYGTDSTKAITIAEGAIQIAVEKLNDKYDIEDISNDIMDRMYAIAAKSSNRSVSRR